jgi:hypothetical protein
MYSPRWKSMPFFALLLLCGALLSSGAAGAQSYTTLSQDLVTWTETTADNLPFRDSFGFVEPTAQDIVEFQEAVDALLDGDLATADTEAADVDYEVVLFTDIGNGNELLHGLFPIATNSDGRGYFLVRPEAQTRRRLVLEAPHPRNDQRSAVVASEVFRASGARAFFFAGTHRCANTGQFTACTGTTEACSATAQSFLESDMAHTDQSFFHAFHTLASVEDTDTITLQLHGFSSDASDPEFVASNGTQTDVGDPLYITNLLTTTLEAGIAAFVAPATPAKDGASCNRIGDQDQLCATHNTQGRFLNNSANACSTAASTASGRFVHLEMSSDLRHPGGTLEPQLVVDAVLAVIPTIRGEIGDRVWVDLNADGVQDPGEPGIDGATVDLFLNGSFHDSVETSGDGRYHFGLLDPGSYHLEVTPPGGYQGVPQGAGLDGTLDSDVDQTTGATTAFNLAEGEIRTDLDAGFEPLGNNGQIGDRVWHDLNANGLDDGEPGVGGLTVRLSTAAGTERATTVTASDGSYGFTGLLPGSYRVALDAPGWGVTATGGDSVLDPQTRQTAEIVLGANTIDNAIDLGLTADCLDVALVPYGSTWKTVNGGTWASDWNQVAFDDADWADVVAVAGFPADDVNGLVTDTDAVTYYFRHTFGVEDASLFQGLDLSIFRDDGAVVYLNGIEILRSNLPAAPAVIGAATRADGSSKAFDSIADLPGSLLVTGTNVLAVEVHQSTPSSSDALLDAHLTATACDPCALGRVDLPATQATFIRSDDVTDNEHSDSTYWAKGEVGTPNDFRSPLLQWDVSSLPGGAAVLSAEVVLDVTNDTDDFYNVYALALDFVDSEATWTQAQDGVLWGTLGTAAPADRGDTILGLARIVGTGVGRFPLNGAGAALIESWRASGDNHGVILTREGPTDSLAFLAATTPVLRVVYTKTGCGG